MKPANFDSAGNR